MRDDTSWIMSYTGRKFWPLDPRAEDIDIVDIAHALSNICRFTGHVRTFYSVAEHCVLASRHVPPEHALAALLHDASEAYLCDIARPVKYQPTMAFYREAETRLEHVICDRFGVDIYDPHVRKIDDRMLVTERILLMAEGPFVVDVSQRIENAGIEGLAPYVIKPIFLKRFEDLNGGHHTNGDNFCVAERPRHPDLDVPEVKFRALVRDELNLDPFTRDVAIFDELRRLKALDAR